MVEHSQPLDLEEALNQIQQQLAVTEAVETVPIEEALGRVLASSVTAPVSLPPFPASAMDGYALYLTQGEALSETPFTIVGESLAGHPWEGEIKAGECVRVFTGGVVPPGSNQVIVQEEVAHTSGSQVTFRPHIPSETFVRPVGHDVKAGAQLLGTGTFISPFALGTLAAAGIRQCEVYRKLKVGVFSTGDELVDNSVAPEHLGPGQIYDSNRVTVLALLQNESCELVDLGRLPDDEQITLSALKQASEDCDLLITSGGVSVGDADFVTSAIESLGNLAFWRLNLKPGKPLAMGNIGNCTLFGLPGNPVSTIVTLLLIVKPALRHMAGRNDGQDQIYASAVLQTPLKHSPGRAEYQRGSAHIEQGALTVTSTGDQSSNRLSSFRDSNCLIHVPKEAGDLVEGTTVEVIPFTGLLD